MSRRRRHSSETHIRPLTRVFVRSLLLLSALIGCYAKLGTAYISASGAHPLQARDFNNDDPTRLCLLFKCGRPRLMNQKLDLPADTSVQWCKNCQLPHGNTPQEVAASCTPVAEGNGVHFTASWESLAHAAMVAPSVDTLLKDETVVLGPSTHGMDPFGGWHITAPYGKNSDSKVLDLTRCFARPAKGHPTDSSRTSANAERYALVDVLFVSFIGTSEAKGVGAVSLEAVALDEPYVQRAFHKGERSKFTQFFGAPEFQSFKKSEGVVLIKRMTVHIADMADFNPQDRFQARLTCHEKKCRLHGLYGCFHVVCRGIDSTQYSFEEARVQVAEYASQYARKFLSRNQQTAPSTVPVPAQLPKKLEPPPLLEQGQSPPRVQSPALLLFPVQNAQPLPLRLLPTPPDPKPQATLSHLFVPIPTLMSAPVAPLPLTSSQPSISPSSPPQLYYFIPFASHAQSHKVPVVKRPQVVLAPLAQTG